MGFLDGAFGLSRSGKQAQNNLNGGLQWLDQRSSNLGGQADDLATRAKSNWANISDRNNDIGNNGIGSASDLRGYGNDLTGDQNGNFDSQTGRLANSYNTTAGIRGEQEGELGKDYNSQVDMANSAYGNVNNIEGRRAGVVNDTINSAYGKARSNLLSAMDAGSATAMRAMAPETASTIAHLRSAGIDPSSPEGIEAMNQVRRGQAEAIDNNLENNVNNQNNLTLGQMNNDVSNVNQLSGTQEQAQLGNFQANSNALNNAENIKEGVLNSGAGDVSNYTNALNNVDQQRVQEGNTQGELGMGYGQSTTGAKQGANNSNLNLYNTDLNGSLGYNNQSLNARGMNLGINQQNYANAQASQGWLGKGLIGAGLGVASAWGNPTH